MPFIILSSEAFILYLVYSLFIGVACGTLSAPQVTNLFILFASALLSPELVFRAWSYKPHRMQGLGKKM